MIPVIEQEGLATDTFFQKDNVVNRLICDFQKYGKLMVAIDFDDTLKPSKPSYSTEQVIELMQVCSKIPEVTIIVFTCRTNDTDLKEVRNFCSNHNIRVDYINENDPSISIETSRKILYSIFLCDRAGLRAAYEDLVGFIQWYYVRR